MIKSVVLGVSFPKELIEKVDEVRNDVSRSRFIQRCLEKQLGIQND
jgi:metal-responsive CopG/Arc/MetJ family transcriptional regulator